MHNLNKKLDNTPYFKHSKSKFSQNTTNLLSKWRHVSTQAVIIRPIIEPCMRYIKWKSTFMGSQNNILVHIFGIPKRHFLHIFGIPKQHFGAHFWDPKTTFFAHFWDPKTTFFAHFWDPKTTFWCTFLGSQNNIFCTFWDPKTTFWCTFLGSQNIFCTFLGSQNNILGPQKYALSLDVPHTWFNNCPHYDTLSRNMSSL